MGRHERRSGPFGVEDRRGSARRPVRRRPTAGRSPQQIRRIEPATSGRETPEQAARRRREASRMVDPRVRLRRRRRRMMISLAVLLTLIVGVAGLTFLWLHNLDTKIHGVINADWKNPEDSLPKDNTNIVSKPFYLALIGVDTRPNEPVQRSDTLMIARVDPEKQQVKIMSIPRDTRVTIPGRGKAKINEAMQRGGPALVIDTVNDFIGIKIDHYVVVNFEGLKDVVDAVGGVRIYVPEAIDDIKAANNHPAAAHIPKGWNTLDGMHALTFVRTRKYADADFSRVKNQQAFVKALYKQALSSSSLTKIPFVVNAVANSITTDMTLGDLASLARVFRGMPDRNIETITMPGVGKYIDGVSYVLAEEADLDDVVRRMVRGQSLTGTETTGTVAPTKGLVPADVTITVRNGAGVSGLAKGAQDILVKGGFKVVETGNMNQFVYGTTLVVYKDQDLKAGMVREALGLGDVIASRGMYSFSSDVLVVVGKDWDPSAISPTARN